MKAGGRKVLFSLASLEKKSDRAYNYSSTVLKGDYGPSAARRHDGPCTADYGRTSRQAWSQGTPGPLQTHFDRPGSRVGARFPLICPPGGGSAAQNGIRVFPLLLGQKLFFFQTDSAENSGNRLPSFPHPSLVEVTRSAGGVVEKLPDGQNP